MKALAAFFDLLPGWAWALLLAGAVAFGFAKEYQVVDLRRQLAEARTDLANYKSAAAESARLAARAFRAEDTRRTDAQREALDAATVQIETNARTAADARSANQRLLRELAKLRAAVRAATEGAAAAVGGPPAGDPIGVLADVLGRCSQRVTVLAEYADRAATAGRLCERSYDALTPPP